jgi:hypothetical protein
MESAEKRGDEAGLELDEFFWIMRQVESFSVQGNDRP